jgi:uracil-DNA glycosylase
LDQSTPVRVRAWLRYADELGLGPYYRDRRAADRSNAGGSAMEPRDRVQGLSTAGSTARPRAAAGTPPQSPLEPRNSAEKSLAPSFTQVSPAASLFDERIENDTLELVREAIGGNCTRCKLHKARTKIVFGVGNPRAELVFVGEGPGHDEDMRGEPFVGRAGKLLTQMIEAMSLAREDVYICNVVKCRPPENRLPEKDEIATCSPFLMRQLGVIQPKVICALGSCAAQTLLQTTQGISRFRGEWFDFHGSKFMATYHPAYLLRNPAAKVEVWKDLRKVMAYLGLQAKRK